MFLSLSLLGGKSNDVPREFSWVQELLG